ncbi:Ribosome-releasing factor 2, mitochondrial [Elasticomyces elasticus]|nr:Ribosome-releasing factor 2, mitochondrial [Elasticomyces elasticus]
MLYYSGFTRRLGDVDEGSTVTDFLPAERARGITIQSAAITFNWPPLPEGASLEQLAGPVLLPRSTQSHNINLIDTPGHADFTFEVLRSLRALDGAVCILDGVAGVEAQTEKVWTQASHYNIPRIVFVNKLDREGAAFGKTVREIGTRLRALPAVCQIPWWRDGGGKLQGTGDAVGLRGLLWEEGGDGKTLKVFGLSELEQRDEKLAAEIKKARVALVELLSEYDDEMVEKFLECSEDHLQIPATDITESLRRCVLHSPQSIIPIFAGASFRNIGVQPLLDAVVDLLPAPTERPDPEVSLGTIGGGLRDLLSGNLVLTDHTLAPVPRGNKKALSNTKATFAMQNLTACALAFKVVNDARRGVLVYVRVYSGSVDRAAALFNTNLQVTERAPRLLQMYANDALEVSSIPAGQIGVIPGLKFARTGDTLVVYSGANPKTGPPAPLNSLQLRPITVPPPVFFTSVEPNSLAEEKHIAESLALLLREDPSLNVTIDEESGQTHLAGMGELHLEIARDRLIQDFKAKATIGNIEIGYREAILSASTECTDIFDRDVAGKASKAGCTVSVSPLHDGNPNTLGSKDAGTAHTIELQNSNTLTIMTPTLHPDGSAINPEAPSLPPTLPMPILYTSLSTGVSAALARGPNQGYPVHSTSIRLTFTPETHFFANTTPASLSSAARMTVQHALRVARDAGGGAESTILMEPVMMVTISVDEASLGGIVHDLSSARGGQVVSLDSEFSASGATAGAGLTDGLPQIDPRKIYAPPDPFAGGAVEDDFGDVSTQARQIVARVPLKEMVGYLKHLRSLTGGRGTFVMSFDRFERMSRQREKVVLGELRGGFV